jgi:signal transduction histidine kinase
MLLNDEVQAQKDALEAQNLALSEINRKKDRFFSIMAHDVRASVAGVLGYAEMLNADVDELSPAEVKNMSANILRGTRTVNGLFENLLQWSRLELNAVQTEFTDIHLAATIQSVASLFDVSMERKDVSLHLDIPNDVIVHTDEYILNTLLRNVLSNAIKFSHPGGKIYVSAVQEPDGTLLLVKDEGIGIPTELLEKIFSNDAGISRPGTKNEQGSGLGMHVCKRLCDTVGIGLQIESGEGQGTLIQLRIPKTPQMEEKK